MFTPRLKNFVFCFQFESRGILEAFDEAQRSADNGFLRDENFSGDFASSVRRYREPLISSMYQ